MIVPTHNRHNEICKFMDSAMAKGIISNWSGEYEMDGDG